MNVRVLQRGTTLLETLVVTAIFAMLSGALFGLFASTARNFSYNTKTVGLQMDLAGALNVLLDDVSLAGFTGYTATQYDPSGTAQATNPDGTTDYGVIDPATALSSITLNGGTNGNPPDSIQFLADIASPSGISPDGRTDRITYQVTSGSLTRTIGLGDSSGGFTAGTSTDTLAANVTGFQVRLFDKAHAPLPSNFQNACYVGATVYTADPNVRGGIPLAKSLSGETALRNFLSLTSCTN
jgi:type II secretory pathway component PulJ